MARVKSAKIAIGSEFAERVQGVTTSIVSEYAGINAEDMRELRAQLRELDSEFVVVKNRVAKKVLEDNASPLVKLDEMLKGQVGLTLVRGDSAQAAKKIIEFSKAHDAFKVKGGVIDDEKVSSNHKRLGNHVD